MAQRPRLSSKGSRDRMVNPGGLTTKRQARERMMLHDVDPRQDDTWIARFPQGFRVGHISNSGMWVRGPAGSIF